MEEIKWELTALGEFLDYRGLWADEQKHVVGEVEDLVSFNFIQAHTDGVCTVQQIHHPGKSRP